MTVNEIIKTLGMQPHPEGGHYSEQYRDTPAGGGRGTVTHIYYLLARGERSAWHRVTDAAEIWHYYAGDALTLKLSEDGGEPSEHTLGTDLGRGQRPHLVVPPNWWQSAESTGDWTLIGCTVAPAFEFSSFEMAPSGLFD